MALYNDMDEMGKKIERKRDEQNKINDAKEQAKEEVKAEERQHEENKRQGMI